MSYATKIAAKVQQAADKLGAFDTRTVYKRTLVESGGDSLIDRGVTRTFTDSALARQPIFSRVGKRAEILSTASVLVNPFDYEFVFTSDQMTVADIENKNVTLVLKDSLGNEEALELVLCNPIVLNGESAATLAVYKSVTR